MTKHDLFKTLGLKNSVGPSLFSNPHDITRIKEILYLSGHYGQRPDNPHPDSELYEGIKAFQRQNSLKPDATINPGGPTDGVLAKKPTYRCIICSAPHAGLYGAYCPPCGIKAGIGPLS